MRWLVVMLVGVLACGDDASVSDAGSDASVDAAVDAAVDATVDREDATRDAGEDDSLCEDLGLARRSFDEAASGTAFEEPAGDFTVQTTEGPWTLRDEWTGCESYVFVNWSATDYGRGLWSAVPDEVFTDGPRNVHYFFAAYAPDEATATMRAMEMQAVVEEGFDFHEVSETDRTFWRTHLHFVTQPLQDTVGSVGELVRASGIILNAFAITRQQRFDPVGSLFTIRSSGFVPSPSMARFAAPYYDYLEELDRTIEGDDSTVVSLLDQETTTSRRLDRTVSLPDNLASFDTLAFDIELTCLLTPDGCSEWDRIAHIFLCDDATCESSREIIRWITPYSRPGRRRWLVDATPLLGLLAPGEQTFRMVFGPDWEEATERTVSVSARLSQRGVGERSMGAELAFRGGEFNSAYNERDPFRFTPPAGTRRVEVVTLVSGHGQVEPFNCAEWCNHQHTFTANEGTPRRIDFEGEAGTTNGCAERAREGVPPGQWGNWSPLRAGWCPGLPVPYHRFDITDDIDLAAENELRYVGNVMGEEPQGGTISLSTYVVYWQ
ncbi:MAG: peptide-N-glycosidase F-related protein [Myxococcota bacterium]